ncbi:ATP synthase gamma chain [Microbacterium faecale]|uniref:ATP synthase gamma chain n=1 Tax=Microbacterium faecale TaxID=1804630 RepID=A0A916Y8B7_9MICO|nr:F0F1 ATP synthase subunit gamma [Microbacterium faecale]GGD34476.1 ATP synthase gamma chain [Microbacterium faecale]HJB64403.1 F0F1 ATP synthase subunit gamma [Candidatus Microbacterium pullistercoris]
MGAQLREYKQKISSAQTTKKITKAMELIAASRIQKAMARVRASSPFSRAVTRAVSAVATHTTIDHVLTREAENPTRSAVLLLTSDRGLAGAFNSQVIKEALELAEHLREEGKEVVFYLFGRKAVGYFQFRQMAAADEWIGEADTPTFETAKQMSDALIAAYELDAAEDGVDEIHVVYNRFVSMMTQEPESVRLLPLEVVESDEAGDVPASAETYPLYEFEPEASEVLDALLPVYIQSRIFNALLQSAAAKQAATQKAMKSASDNADKLITDYTRLRNNARQAEITQQIAEIVGGADALAS